MWETNLPIDTADQRVKKQMFLPIHWVPIKVVKKHIIETVKIIMS
jgi:hypothetical protein